MAKHERTTHAPAIEDAEAVLARVRKDEDDARVERDRLNAGGSPQQLDAGASPVPLRTAESVIDVRAAVQAERLESQDEPGRGRLILTNERIVLSGPVPLDVPLGEINEVSLAGERLMLALRDGTGWCLDVPAPRLFRVRLADAIARRRGGDRGAVWIAPAPA